MQAQARSGSSRSKRLGSGLIGGRIDVGTISSKHEASNGGQHGEDDEVSEVRATIVDVARRAGVSKSTVSLVLGGSSLVADATRERVSRGDDRTRLHLSPRRGDASRRQIRRPRHGHQRPLQPVLCRARDRHRAGVPGRGLHSVSRQFRRGPGPPAGGHPLDARAWRGRARARRRDRTPPSATSKPWWRACRSCR